jgi:hypothetical protein
MTMEATNPFQKTAVSAPLVIIQNQEVHTPDHPDEAVGEEEQTSLHLPSGDDLTIPQSPEG